jgi:F-type H+-transporting ATPase subunit delta
MRDALSTHYAQALTNAIFAPDSGLSPEDAGEQLANAADALNESQKLQLVLLSPAVTRARKQAVIGKLADDMGLHRLIKNFLLVLVSHRRTGELNAIREEFGRLVDERTGWLRAEITSAHELDAAEREQIERSLGTQLGKFIRARYKVDPAVIGGVRAHVGSKEYDATIRGKLEGLRQRLVAHL